MPTPRTKAGGARPEALFQPPPERQPLAARMRPRTLDEFVGQEHLVGERGPLRRSVARGRLSSILLWGPPGTGKTSLARLLAQELNAHFVTMSAVMSGVADVRATIAAAQDRLALNQQRTILWRQRRTCLQRIDRRRIHFIAQPHRRGLPDVLLPYGVRRRGDSEPILSRFEKDSSA